jgi:phosphatidylglycerophosphate synthase
MSVPPPGSGSLVSSQTRSRVKKLAEPIALFLGRLGLTPDGLTVLGFGITAVGAVLAGAEAWLVAGLVVFAGGAFDLVDGTLARATGRVSRFGAFMDSVFDRWGEGVVYVGIVLGGAAWRALPPLAAFAMASAFMVSYTRARSEGLGFSPGSGMASVGLAPREIRLVILSIGLVATGLLGGTSGPGFVVSGLPEPWFSFRNGSWAMALALGLIGGLATITVVQRIIHVRQQAVASDRK